MAQTENLGGGAHAPSSYTPMQAPAASLSLLQHFKAVEDASKQQKAGREPVNVAK